MRLFDITVMVSDLAGGRWTEVAARPSSYPEGTTASPATPRTRCVETGRLRYHLAFSGIRNPEAVCAIGRTRLNSLPRASRTPETD